MGQDGKPASRPVCSASASINGELSEYVSKILESVAAALPTLEVISGEEMRSQIDELVKKLDKLETPKWGYCVSSLDVKALYPSPHIEQYAKLCAQRMIRNKIKFEDADYHWAGIYCALNMEKETIDAEGLGRVIPRRLVNKNKRPTVLTVGTDEVKNRWEWEIPQKSFTEDEKL